MKPEEYNNIESEDDGGINIDIKRILADVLKYWWAFVASVAIVLSILYVYHRYKIPVYRAYISVIVDDKQKTSSMTDQQSMMSGFMLTPGMQNLDNQLAILRSWTMVKKTIEKLDFYVSYYHHGRISTQELYESSPVTIVMDSTHSQIVDVPLYIDVEDSDSFTLTAKAEIASSYIYHSNNVGNTFYDIDFSKKFKFDEPIITAWGAFSVHKNGRVTGKNYSVVFRNPSTVISSYRNQLSVTTDDKGNSSVVTMSINGTNRTKNLAFLNKMVEVFLNDNLNQKNQIASNTIRFIEEQLGFIADSLQRTGTQLSDFRTVHGIQQTVSSKGETIFKEIQEFESNIRTLELHKSYYNYLSQYFSNDSILTGVIAPAMFDTKSPVIASQLNNIMELNAERLSYQDTYGKPNNPASIEVLAKLQIAKNTLLQSVQSHVQMVNDNISNLKSKVDEYSNELYSLPETERLLLGIERKFDLNNEVYDYLLRKRSESQIQKASNTSDHKIVDPAMFAGLVSPNIAKDRGMALAFALALPLIVIVLFQLFDDKFRSSDDLSKNSPYPIMGEVLNNSKLTPKVVLEHPKSVVAETFRRLRTRLEFMIADVKTPIIAVSSSMAGEGKTFCAFNIASIYAYSGKKTILLGMDMRKPGLAKIYDAQDDNGLASYLIGACTKEESIHQYADNLYIFPSGVIPPNPAELIMSKHCKDLLEDLKKEYDVIIIDTPPMGLVSDAYTIARMSDVVVFIARQGYTVKPLFKQTVSSFSAEGIKNVGLVFNDVEIKKSKYGYGGKYGYHKYGYYNYSYYSGYYTE